MIVAGSGMGGMSAAALLANEGYRVAVLEAAHAPGGCSSSYYRQGYWFESGATTLIGFDEHQPLRYLEEQTGMEIPRIELRPAMQVYQNGTVIQRHKDLTSWIEEASNAFGNGSAQQRFWKLAAEISDLVWKASLDNHFFPPESIADWAALLRNNRIRDAWILPYAFRSVGEVMRSFGVASPAFVQFVDEQLMITAQATAANTPFLFGAPALTYTNYSNYYVPGGLINMVQTISDFIERNGGDVRTKTPVRAISRKGTGYMVDTPKGKWEAPVVLSNIPVWNMAELTSREIRAYFSEQSEHYQKAWGAYTMGVVTDDTYEGELPLHHQIHINGENKPEEIASDSVFVSLSHPEDRRRAPDNSRVLNISTHTRPGQWYLSDAGAYERRAQAVSDYIIDQLERSLPGFSRNHIRKNFSATPLTWENWVYRKKGRVGGIPQDMSRSLFDWMPAKTPFDGLYLCGDTVFPGQGIPGVTISGKNAFYRIKRYLS